MFKKMLSIFLALLVVGLASVVALQPAKAAAETWHYSFSGMGGDASFSNCNYWPIPAGTICTDTYISVAEQVYKADGTKYPSTTMSFNQYQYKIDKFGNWVYLSDSWGYGDASLTIDRKLSSATASATLLVSSCTADKKGNYTCKESTLPVAVSWTGVGDLVRSVSSSHTVSKGYTYNSHFNGTYRDAIAEVSGFAVGTSSWASLFNSRWMDVYISRGGW